jgi:hypothetical protein
VRPGSGRRATVRPWPGTPAALELEARPREAGPGHCARKAAVVAREAEAAGPAAAPVRVTRA